MIAKQYVNMQNEKCFWTVDFRRMSGVAFSLSFNNSSIRPSSVSRDYHVQSVCSYELSGKNMRKYKITE